MYPSPHNKPVLTEKIIKEINRLILNTERDSISKPGTYSPFSRHTTYGIRHEYESAENIPLKMPGFVKRYNDLVKDSDCKSLNDYFLEAAKLLSTFFQIHPFGDGNGRTARIIYSVMAINKAPFLIPMTHTERYNLDLTDALVRDIAMNI